MFRWYKAVRQTPPTSVLGNNHHSAMLVASVDEPDKGQWEGPLLLQVSRASAEKTWTTRGDSHSEGTIWRPLHSWEGTGAGLTHRLVSSGTSMKARHVTSHVRGLLTALLLGSEKGDTRSNAAEPKNVPRARRKLPGLSEWALGVPRHHLYHILSVAVRSEGHPDTRRGKGTPSFDEGG